MKIINLGVTIICSVLQLFLVGCTNNTPVDGVKIVYSIDAEDTSDDTNIEIAKNIIGKRIETFYARDYSIEIDKTNPYNSCLVVKIQKETDAEVISNKLGVTANLKFVEPDGTVAIDGKDIIDAKTIYGETGLGKNGYYIQLTLSDSGADKLADATERQIGKYITILLDDNILATPSVVTRIESKNLIIAGNYTREEANELADLISLGALPFKFKVESAEYINNLE